MAKLDFEGGKYTVIHDNGCNFTALRYGKEWRSLVGDALVLAIVQEYEDVLIENKKLHGYNKLMEYVLNKSATAMWNSESNMDNEAAEIESVLAYVAGVR